MLRKSRRAFAALLLLPFVAGPAAATEAPACPPSKTWTTGSEEEAGVVLAEGPGVVAERIAGPFDVPWSVAFLPDGSFLITERPGRLQHVKPGADPLPVSGVPSVFYEKHGGLLDVAVDPDFANNGLVYMSYLQGDETASSMRVIRARLDEESETLTDELVLFEGTPGQKPEQIGGRIALTDDGFLFLSLGDTWDGNRAQDVGDTAGTIIRIRTDGAIPEDNPFKHRVGARPEIWSYGHRNPQGLAFDKTTSQLWSTEHGPQGGDELNRIVRGGNYGWPIATYGVDYSGHPLGVNSQAPDTVQPVHYWVPLSIAPSGLAVDSQPTDATIWLGTLGGEMVVQLGLVGNCVVSERHFLKHELGRIRDVRIDSNGATYILTDGGEGTLYRLQTAPDEVSQKTHL